MITTDQQNKLIAYYANVWKQNFSVAQLDAAYAQLSTQQKQTIVNSIMANDGTAAQLVATLFAQMAIASATTQVQGYITNNSIPLDAVLEVLP